MNKKSLFIALVILFSLVSCASEYRKQGSTTWGHNVGYSDFEIGKNKYKVSYSGNSDDKKSYVMQMAYRRAKEICHRDGFDNYIFTNVATSESESVRIGNTQFSTSFYSLDVECVQ